MASLLNFVVKKKKERVHFSLIIIWCRNINVPKVGLKFQGLIIFIRIANESMFDFIWSSAFCAVLTHPNTLTFPVRDSVALILVTTTYNRYWCEDYIQYYVLKTVLRLLFFNKWTAVVVPLQLLVLILSSGYCLCWLLHVTPKGCKRNIDTFEYHSIMFLRCCIDS